MKTGRMFLEGMLLAVAVAGLSAGLPIGRPQEFPRKPQAIELPPPDFPSPTSPAKRTPEENNKDARKKIDRLYQLAAEMKAEVDKPDSANVLSLNLLKKAEEIEKLAHEIRKRARG